MQLLALYFRVLCVLCVMFVALFLSLLRLSLLWSICGFAFNDFVARCLHSLIVDADGVDLLMLHISSTSKKQKPQATHVFLF